MNDFYSSFVSIHYIICECGDTFSTEDALQNHLENEHDCTERNEFQCSTCGRIFKTKQACLTHQQSHITMGSRQRKEARDPSKAKKRYYNSKNIVCEVCGRKYASNAALRYHQRVHTGERPYQCPMCPKTFTMPLFLQIHIRTHTGERPYECPLCPKAFSNKAALLRHDRVHTGVKPYECPQCGKFFTQSNSMKLHVNTVHLKMPAPYKSKNRKAKEAQRNLAIMTNPEEMPVKIIVAETAGGKSSKTSKPKQVKIEPEPQATTVEEVQEGEEEYQEVKEMFLPNEEGHYEQVKVEITEIPMYEEGVEQSDVVYEEVYETEEEV